MYKKTGQPCPCGQSSDACTYFYNDDESIGYKCYSSNCTIPNTGITNVPQKLSQKEIIDKYNIALPSSDEDQSHKGYGPISAKTLKFFGVRRDSTGNLYFPLKDNTGQTHWKVRVATDEKKYRWLMLSRVSSRDLKPFGLDKFEGDNRKLTITTGHKDALAVYEMNGGYPVISVHSDGDALTCLQDAYTEVDKFDEIIYAFDNDESGQRALGTCIELFPGKTKSMSLQYKDPYDYLNMSKPLSKSKQEWQRDFFNARSVEAKGFLSGKDLIKLAVEAEDRIFYPYPWDEMNNELFGWSIPSLIVTGAGTGQGKTTWLSHIAVHNHNNIKIDGQPISQGIIFLEDPNKDAAEKLLSVHSQHALHLPSCNVSTEQRLEYAKELFDDGRIMLYDNAEFDGHSFENVFQKIRLAVKAKGCKVIFLDHITYLAGIDAEAEGVNRLDQWLTKLSRLAIELDIAIFCNAQFKKPGQGTVHEEGREATLADFKGTANISQLSWTIFSLERNQQGTATQRGRTLVRVLKHRFAGRSGPLMYLDYCEEPFMWVSSPYTEESEMNDKDI